MASVAQQVAPSTARLGHLKLLEAESIHVMREVAAEFQKPVMLYSIGKDSSVMLRLAQKAFFPGPIPFPLLHVDTGYKFREMLEFRDAYTKELGVNLIVHRNEEALRDGTNPVRLGTQRCCGLLKTTSLLDALREGGFDAAFGGARRDEEKSRAKERIFSFRDSAGPVGSEESAAGVMEPLQRPHRAGRKHSRVSTFQLDRVGHMALHPSGKHPRCSPLFRKRTQNAGSRRQLDPS